MLAANEASPHIWSMPASPPIYRIHEMPDPKRVMEFEEIAAHFGYSLGIGAIPVKRFGITDKHRDGSKKRREVTVADSETHASPRATIRSLVAKIEGKPEERILSYLMLRSLKQARYSDGKCGPLRPGRRHLHALHVAHPPLSRPDGAPPAARCPHRQAHSWRRISASRWPTSARNPSAAPPRPSANSSSGRRSSS